MAVRSFTPVPVLLLFVLSVFLTSPTSAASISSGEVESMQRVVRSHGYNLICNAMDTSELQYELLKLPPNASITIFAPSDASLFAVHRVQTASFYTKTLRLHVVPRRLSLAELRSGSMLQTLLPNTSLRFTTEPIKVAGVEIAFPGLFYSRRIIVHGLAGVLSLSSALSLQATAPVSDPAATPRMAPSTHPSRLGAVVFQNSKHVKGESLSRERGSVGYATLKEEQSVVFQNRWPSLCLEKGDKESLGHGAPQVGIDIKHEAMFLEAKTTMFEAPVGHRKASELYSSPSHDMDAEFQENQTEKPHTAIRSLKGLMKNSPGPNPNDPTLLTNRRVRCALFLVGLGAAAYIVYWILRWMGLIGDKWCTNCFGDLKRKKEHKDLKEIKELFNSVATKDLAVMVDDAKRKAKEEADAKDKEEAEKKAKEEVEKKAKEEADAKAKSEKEKKAREEADAKAEDNAGHTVDDANREYFG